MKFNTLFIAAVTLLAGCGVSDDKLITEIDTDLWAKICANDAVAYDSDAETVTCDDGSTVDIPAVTAATREANCLMGNTTATWTEAECADVTFGDWKDFADYDRDVCDPTDIFENAYTTCSAAHAAAM